MKIPSFSESTSPDKISAFPFVARVVAQTLLASPILSLLGVLGWLFISVPESLSEGSITKVVFGLIALPSALVLLASIAVPTGWVRKNVLLRAALIIGLALAIICCGWVAILSFFDTDGAWKGAESFKQIQFVFGPLIVAVWNCIRIALRR